VLPVSRLECQGSVRCRECLVVGRIEKTSHIRPAVSEARHLELACPACSRWIVAGSELPTKAIGGEVQLDGPPVVGAIDWIQAPWCIPFVVDPVPDEIASIASRPIKLVPFEGA